MGDGCFICRQTKLQKTIYPLPTVRVCRDHTTSIDSALTTRCSYHKSTELHLALRVLQRVVVSCMSTVAMAHAMKHAPGVSASGDAEDLEGTIIQGWLRKSHAGEAFKDAHSADALCRRGFHVFYYASPDNAHVHGHFDLRNVVEISPTEPNDGAPRDSIRISVAEGYIRKRIIIAFSTDRADTTRATWLRTWCSAIEHKWVHRDFDQYFDAALAARFDRAFGDTPAISCKRRTGEGYVKNTPRLAAEILSPRRGAGEQSEASSGASRLTSPDSSHRSAPSQRSGSSGGLLQAYEVLVPKNAAPGDMLKMALPPPREAQVIQITIPPNAKPGSLLTFELPTESASTEWLSQPSPSAAQLAAPAPPEEARAPAGTRVFVDDASEAAGALPAHMAAAARATPASPQSPPSRASGATPASPSSSHDIDTPLTEAEDPSSPREFAQQPAIPHARRLLLAAACLPPLSHRLATRQCRPPLSARGPTACSRTRSERPYAARDDHTRPERDDVLARTTHRRELDHGRRSRSPRAPAQMRALPCIAPRPPSILAVSTRDSPHHAVRLPCPPLLPRVQSSSRRRRRRRRAQCTAWPPRSRLRSPAPCAGSALAHPRNPSTSTAATTRSKPSTSRPRPPPRTHYRISLRRYHHRRHRPRPTSSGHRWTGCNGRRNRTPKTIQRRV